MIRTSLVVAALLAAYPVAAQDVMTPGAPAEACKAPNVTVDARITGCSKIIDDKKETGRALAVAYCNRGFALTEQREFRPRHG